MRRIRMMAVLLVAASSPILVQTGVAGPAPGAAHARDAQQPAPKAEPRPSPTPGPGRKVDPKVYDAYVGRYEIPDVGFVDITREGDKLMGQQEGREKRVLVPESETQFFVEEEGAQVTFVKDDKGQVTHMLIRINDRELEAKKIK